MKDSVPGVAGFDVRLYSQQAMTKREMSDVSLIDPEPGERRPDHQINALGLLCPLPILLAARDMGGLREGQIMALMGDDPGLLEDVPAWCDKAGHQLLELEDDDGVIFAHVRKGKPSTP